MRRWPSPLSVTLPPPSSTTFGPLALRTFAVAVIVIVTGAGPQLNVMMPPAATAVTTAAEVQLAGVPVPMIRVGFEVSTARASAGTVALPFGLPAASTFVGGLRARAGPWAAEAVAGARRFALTAGRQGRRRGGRAGLEGGGRVVGRAGGQGRGGDTEDEQSGKRRHAHPVMLGAATASRRIRRAGLMHR